MKDTIHLGWLGWLAFDKAVDPFYQSHTSSDLSSEWTLFSKDWATYDGDVKNFNRS